MALVCRTSSRLGGKGRTEGERLQMAVDDVVWEQRSLHDSLAHYEVPKDALITALKAVDPEGPWRKERAGRPRAVSREIMEDLRTLVAAGDLRLASLTMDAFKEILLAALKKEAIKKGINPYTVELPRKTTLYQVLKNLNMTAVPTPAVQSSRRLLIAADLRTFLSTYAVLAALGDGTERWSCNLMVNVDITSVDLKPARPSVFVREDTRKQLEEARPSVTRTEDQS